MGEYLAPRAGAWGYGGWEEHPLEGALGHYLLGKRQLAKPLERLGVPCWNVRWKLKYKILPTTINFKIAARRGSIFY